MPENKLVRCAIILFMMVPFVAIAQMTNIKEHRVVKGDTLWDISKQEMKDPFLWPKIWKTNPDIKNPHKIYPDQLIRLPAGLTETQKNTEQNPPALRQVMQEKTAAAKTSTAFKRNETVAEAEKTSKKENSVSDKRFDDLKGIILYGGEVIEGEIIDMTAEKVLIRTPHGAVLTYRFVEDVQAFIDK